MRIVTWNVHSCVGLNGDLSVAEVADLLAGLEPDVVCLQEVCRRMPNAGWADQPGAIARALGGEAAFHAGWGNHLVGFGNVIVSRLPVLSVQRLRLPNRRERPAAAGERRGLLAVAVEGPAGPVRVCCTHWSLSQEDRGEAASVVAEALAEGSEPVVLAGDLNATAHEPEVLAVIERVRLTDFGASAAACTFPAHQPQVRIDYILGRGVRAVRVHTPLTRASDHLPVVADLL